MSVIVFISKEAKHCNIGYLYVLYTGIGYFFVSLTEQQHYETTCFSVMTLLLSEVWCLLYLGTVQFSLLEFYKEYMRDIAL
jgi:hypothetical protein